VRGNYRLGIGPHHLFSQNDAIPQRMIDLFDKEELVSFSRDAKILQRVVARESQWDDVKWRAKAVSKAN
jgi:hypothetical protein